MYRDSFLSVCQARGQTSTQWWCNIVATLVLAYNTAPHMCMMLGDGEVYALRRSAEVGDSQALQTGWVTDTRLLGRDANVIATSP